ncbi:MAG TPA: nucleotidyltransferase domain-containing protein [Candidatus Lokiarchaeia archaeon]|nr:nucleotidyltransferase domain-containing protein [Candidatus Lokiarchaeia archaeon]
MKLESAEMTDAKYIQERIQQILAQCGIIFQQILLFGSRARGTSNPTSDYDFLIITQSSLTLKEKRAIEKEIRKTLAKYPLDLIIKSQSEVEILQDQIGSVVREALKEAVSL